MITAVSIAGTVLSALAVAGGLAFVAFAWRNVHGRKGG